uniref:Polyprotein protein n=1 Tax=Solanum tuberosum TaxID=4113 RepID=M1DHD2_SOLTU
MPTVIEMVIERVTTPLIDRVTRCEEMVELHGVRCDNLTVRLKAQEDTEGSSSLFNTMRGELNSLWADVNQLSWVVERVDVTEVIDDDDDKADDDLSKESDEDEMRERRISRVLN